MENVSRQTYKCNSKGVTTKSKHHQSDWVSGWLWQRRHESSINSYSAPPTCKATVCLGVAVTSPNQQGSLELRLSIAFIHRRPLFQVVIPLFILWVLSKPENETVRWSCIQTDAHTYRPRHKTATLEKSIFYKPSSPVVRHRGHVKLNVKWIWQTCLIELFMVWVTVWYIEWFCTVPSDIGDSMRPSFLRPPLGGCHTRLWWMQNGQEIWLIMIIIINHNHHYQACSMTLYLHALNISKDQVRLVIFDFYWFTSNNTWV